MALSGNPIIKSFSNSVSSAYSSGSSLAGENFASLKQNLSETVDRVSGSIGTPLNGSTNGISNFSTAFGGSGNPAQSIAGVAGTVANVAGDIGRSINSLGLGGALGKIGSLATAVSSAAGQINNVLSLFRGKNLPAGGDLFSEAGARVSLQPSAENDWRVRINCNFGLFGNSFDRLQATNGVVWPFTPSVSIATTANYNAIEVTHNNYPFYAYKNSRIEDITINGEFSAETETDAEYWLQATTFFKTATKMFYGASQYAGNPPVVCQLSGYGPGVFNQVPIIVKSFNIEMPNDVDYVKCSRTNGAGPTWVPIVSNISVTVSPIYNRSLLRKFSLQNYANGKELGYM